MKLPDHPASFVGWGSGGEEEINQRLHASEAEQNRPPLKMAPSGILQRRVRASKDDSTDHEEEVAVAVSDSEANNSIDVFVRDDSFSDALTNTASGDGSGIEGGQDQDGDSDVVALVSSGRS